MSARGNISAIAATARRWLWAWHILMLSAFDLFYGSVTIEFSSFSTRRTWLGATSVQSAQKVSAEIWHVHYVFRPFRSEDYCVLGCYWHIVPPFSVMYYFVFRTEKHAQITCLFFNPGTSHGGAPLHSRFCRNSIYVIILIIIIIIPVPVTGRGGL
jgi:hypothetical protein